MCTVTWFRTESGFELFFNRDERDERSPEEPVTVRDHPGGQHLAPRDPDGGGTWLAVSPTGWTLGLLNGDLPEPPEPAGGWQTRGTLIPQLIADPQRALQQLMERDLASLRPFTLIAMSPAGQASVRCWDGNALAEAGAPGPHGPLTSSGRDPVALAEARQQLLTERLDAAGQVTREVFLDYHCFADEGRQLAPGHAPCVHREGIHTRSLCHVVVDLERVAVFHALGAPDRTALGPAVSLPRLPQAP